MDNAELLRRIQADAPGAFEEFVDRFGDRIYGFGLQMCGEREDARDVAQDTLLQAYRSLKNLKHPEAMRSWVYRVVSNACQMKRRKGQYQVNREVSLEELMPAGENDFAEILPDPAETPDNAALRAEAEELVRKAIHTLPPHYRIVLLLRDMEQFTTRETSKILNLPESTVKMRLHRGRLMVRRELESGSGAGGRSDVS
jgi:RNA polymerase sigma-70 factor (ECF subfamily)